MALQERDISFKVLYDIKIKGAFSNIALKDYLTNDLNPMEVNLVREIVYGVIENQIYIDYIISKASKIKLNKIHEKILIILEMGVYQLLFMDRIPESAAVNESVKLAKKHGHKGTIGFVNGILRNISRNKEEYLKINEKDKKLYLSIKYSHPKWLIDRWVKAYGLEFTEDLCRANNSKAQLNIRVNKTRISRSNLKEGLIKKGFIVNDANYAMDSLVIENPFKVTETEEYKNGLFTIQDESSSLVGQIMNPERASLVIDLCAAPGGKSTHMAEIMDDKGEVLSYDIYDHKIKLIDKNSKRLGLNIVRSSIGDAEELNEELLDKGDYVLVDAPCSGFGLLRRRPEIKFNRKESDLDQLVELQYRILNNGKKYVKKGGILLYSTCTIEDRENIHQIKRFLKENENFRLVGIEDRLVSSEKLDSLNLGYLQLFPHIHKTDGFFIAKLMKVR